MGFKKVLPKFALINGGNMTGTATINSPAVFIENIDNIGLQVSWTGTPVGTITINGSIDGVTYSSFDFSPTLAQPAGSPGSYLVSINQAPFDYLQVSYTNASGSGSLTVFILGKDLN